MEKANAEGEPPWVPKAWMTKNTTGIDNYVLLEAEGKGKYVGCNLNIDVFTPQANEWYGEGDDMFYIDGEPWPPSLHGTGTENYFSTAFGPAEEYHVPYSGITVYWYQSEPHKAFPELLPVEERLPRINPWEVQEKK